MHLCYILGRLLYILCEHHATTKSECCYKLYVRDTGACVCLACAPETCEALHTNYVPFRTV